MLNTSSRR